MTKKKNHIDIFIFLILYLIGMSACNQSQNENQSIQNIAGASSTAKGIQYKFYTQNNESRKAQTGDRISFQLLVQNNLDSIISNQTFKELPFEEDFFIGKEYFKDVFGLISEGDSLSFWIPADSLFNKPGYLKTPKIKEGTQIKYTLKVLEIQNTNDIKNRLEKNLQVQREIDDKKIEGYITRLTSKDSAQKFLETDSGLRYRVLKEGIGQSPIIGDTILLNYTSRLLSGKVYDYSEENTEYLLGDALPSGFDESIALLKEGGKGVFILPSALGFGPKGMGTVVPANSVLLFDIELIKIK
jgi:FKBP-type peptidyl-prolyl cis-trans isomerase